MKVNVNDSVVRIALVEDDIHFQQAIREAIEGAPEMVLLSVSSTRAQGLLALEGEPADVLLVDLGLPDGSGIDVIRAACAKWPRCSIMVCTAFGDEQHVMQSLEAGAAGYLLKDSAPRSMVDEIRSLSAGGSPISPLIARQILMRFVRTDKATNPPASTSTAATASAAAKHRAVLSPREQEVLEFITKGFTADEIAALMALSRHTVLTFVRRIYGKLKVTSKAEAIYEARQQGLLDA